MTGQINQFQLAKTLPILEVLDAFNLPYKKQWSWYVMVIDGKPDTSFSIDIKRNFIKNFWWQWEEWKAINIIWQLVFNLSIDELQTDENKSLVIKAFEEKWLIPKTEFTKTEDKEPKKHDDILEQFHSLTLGWYNSCLQRFLQGRWLDYEWIHRNNTKIWEVFRDVWFLQSYYCSETQESEPRSTQVLLFPVYNEHGDLNGLKIRRIDNKKIRWVKSVSVWSVGLLYTDISLDTMILVEWEVDYIVLKLLWFDNVIANCWGVQSLKKEIKELLSDTKNIICLYDSDTPWLLWAYNLQEYLGRQLMVVDFPIRKDKYGKDITDVNDLYKAWYNTKKKWDDILKTAHSIWIDNNKEEYNQEFVFLRKTLEYYDIVHKTIQQTWPVAAYLWLTPRELAQTVKSNQIRTYQDLCYREWGRKWYYNTLDETTILKDTEWAEPILHPHIEKLIKNISWGLKRDSEWIYQSILYKLTHINDPYVPALILYGSGGSWKGTFLNLLWKIFWQENMLIGLWQRDLEWSFDSYQGEKLIVEYKEISSWNKREDKKILDKIKWIISEATITVNAKFRNVRQVESIARFHFSSNHSIPIQMDSKHSWNRRFTVIKTWPKLNSDIAREMNEVTFNDRQVIQEFVARLYHTFPDVVKMSHFPALDNNTKKVLEMNCESSSNLFFERFEEKYPYITKITNKEKNKLLRMYCEEAWEDYDDIKFKQANFDNNLSHRCEKKRIKIRWKSVTGYYINKNPFELEKYPLDAKKEFDEGEVKGFII